MTPTVFSLPATPECLVLTHYTRPLILLWVYSLRLCRLVLWTVYGGAACFQVCWAA